MCTEYVRELAGAVISSVNPTSYGRMRTKLNKQGFSEIAIYTAITKHCVENNIDPKNMAKETLEYLEGCAINMFHPKTSNDFHFLRGHFHKLRHGDLDRDEAKSSEQKGNFLCNHCYKILPDKLRSAGKNEKNMCAQCKSAKSKAYHARKSAEKGSPIKKAISSSSIQTELTKALSTSGPGFKHADASSQLSEALNSLPEPAIKKPEPEPKPIEPEQSTNEPEKLDMAKPESNEENKFGNDVKITEVMADAESATISIQCPTEVLHLVLASIKNL